MNSMNKSWSTLSSRLGPTCRLPTKCPTTTITTIIGGGKSNYSVLLLAASHICVLLSVLLLISPSSTAASGSLSAGQAPSSASSITSVGSKNHVAVLHESTVLSQSENSSGKQAVPQIPQSIGAAAASHHIKLEHIVGETVDSSKLSSFSTGIDHKSTLQQQQHNNNKIKRSSDNVAFNEDVGDNRKNVVADNDETNNDDDKDDDDDDDEEQFYDDAAEDNNEDSSSSNDNVLVGGRSKAKAATTTTTKAKSNRKLSKNSAAERESLEDESDEEGDDEDGDGEEADSDIYDDEDDAAADEQDNAADKRRKDNSKVSRKSSKWQQNKNRKSSGKINSKAKSISSSSANIRKQQSPTPSSSSSSLPLKSSPKDNRGARITSSSSYSSWSRPDKQRGSSSTSTKQQNVANESDNNRKFQSKSSQKSSSNKPNSKKQQKLSTKIESLNDFSFDDDEEEEDDDVDDDDISDEQDGDKVDNERDDDRLADNRIDESRKASKSKADKNNKKTKAMEMSKIVNNLTKASNNNNKNAKYYDTKYSLSTTEICDDVRCEPDEYCFVPEPGVAECLRKPSYARQIPKPKSTKSKGSKSSNTMINLDSENSNSKSDFEDKKKMIFVDKKKSSKLPKQNQLKSKSNKSEAKKASKYDLKDDEDYDDDDDDDSDDYVDDNQETLKRKLPDLPPEQASEQYNNSKIVQCPSCPFGKGQIVCGTDNSTYSSMCRMEFHNCIHRSSVKFACFGFCPCMRVYEKVLLRPENVKNFAPTPKSSPPTGRSSLKAQYYQKQKSSSSSETKIKLKKVSGNSVLQKKDLNKYHYQMAKPKSAECSTEQLRSMGLRLLDWFLVVMKEELKHQTPEKDPIDEIKKWKKSAPNRNFTKLIKPKKKELTELPDCEPQVSFMFFHFDSDHDYKLSVKELYYLEHDENEHCLEPYLTQCDEDRDQYLSAYEWCSCFNLKSKPCLYHVKHMQQELKSSKMMVGAYVPQCTSAGHYEKVQCHQGTSYCWCSDKNGNEIAGTRVRGKHPTCDKTYPLIKNRQYPESAAASTRSPPTSTTTVKPPKSSTPPDDVPEDLEEGDDDDDSTNDNFNLDQGSGSSSNSNSDQF